VAIKLGATGITFQDNSVQTTAGGPVTTQYAIGSYVLGRPGNRTNYNDATIAGSSLYVTLNAYITDPEDSGLRWANSLYNANVPRQLGSQLLVNTGSWRCVSQAAGDGSTIGTPGLWVRYA
jgi:hypothetical protein